MNQLPDVSIRLCGRDYCLGFTRGVSGANWLMLMNQQSGAVLPATVIESRASLIDEVYVYESDGIHGALRQAGIVSMGSVSQPSLGLAVRKCQIHHVGLVAGLAKIQAIFDKARLECAAASTRARLKNQQSVYAQTASTKLLKESSLGQAASHALEQRRESGVQEAGSLIVGIEQNQSRGR